MRIDFTSKLSVADLVAAFSQEGIGWETDFNSSASLYVRIEAVPEGDERVKPLSECRPELINSGDGLHRLDVAAVWRTYWSGFHYILWEDGTWTYYGAAKGWMAQQLLPVFGDVEIVQICTSLFSRAISREQGDTGDLMTAYWRLREDMESKEVAA